MAHRAVFVLGLAAGYVLGARAGRKRYDQIAATAGRVWNSPPVKKQVDNVEDFLKDKAPVVVGLVADGAKKAASAASTASKSAKSSRSTASKSVGTEPAS